MPPVQGCRAAHLASSEHARLAHKGECRAFEPFSPHDSTTTARPPPAPQTKILLDILREIEAQTEPASPETAAFSEADEKVIAQLKARFSKAET